jgi:hypothetical protein
MGVLSALRAAACGGGRSSSQCHALPLFIPSGWAHFVIERKEHDLKMNYRTLGRTGLHVSEIGFAVCLEPPGRLLGYP